MAEGGGMMPTARMGTSAMSNQQHGDITWRGLTLRTDPKPHPEHAAAWVCELGDDIVFTVDLLHSGLYDACCIVERQIVFGNVAPLDDPATALDESLEAMIGHHQRFLDALLTLKNR